MGTGKPTSISDIAKRIANLLSKDISPLLTRQYRAGDIRHCYADTSQIENAGFRPTYRIEEGLEETIEWASKQKPQDLSENAIIHLKRHGLIYGGNDRST